MYSYPQPPPPQEAYYPPPPQQGGEVYGYPPIGDFVPPPPSEPHPDDRRRDDERRRRDDDDDRRRGRGGREDDDRRRRDEEDRRRGRGGRDDDDRRRRDEDDERRRRRDEDDRRRRDDERRKRSRSPGGDRESSSRRREPRPRISGRTKPSVNWDVAPPGFEGVKASVYKEMMARGQVPVPVAFTVGSMPTAAMPTQATRQSRRLYVGNMPPQATEKELEDFFNRSMASAGLVVGSGAAILSTQVNHEKSFGFLEFRSVEECTNCLQLQGIVFYDNALNLRRPKDYVGGPDAVSVGAGGFVSAPVPLLAGIGFPPIPGASEPSSVPDGPNKLVVHGLPALLDDAMVRELLEQFGALAHFDLLKTPTGASRGLAFCEYADPLVTDVVVAGLHGMVIGDATLAVHRAGPRILAAAPLLGSSGGMGAMSTAALGSVAGALVGAVEATRVLVLLNMVTAADLAADDEYADIAEDVRAECDKFGRVLHLEIPRAGPGAGKIYVEYEDVASAQRAQRALSGRKFDQRIVITTYMDEAQFESRVF